MTCFKIVVDTGSLYLQLSPLMGDSISENGGYVVYAGLQDSGCSSCEGFCGGGCGGGGGFPRPAFNTPPTAISGRILSSTSEARFTSAVVTELSMLPQEINQAMKTTLVLSD